jgi:hypothetical protein
MPGKGTFRLDALREAVRRRVNETSIRAVAAEIGMSPSGLHVLLGGSRPHPTTREKLLSWYLEERQRTQGDPEFSADDVDAAMRLLVRYVQADGRESARARRLHEVVRRIQTESGVDDR